MPPALWLLLRLRTAGWFRRFGRSLKTVKGALASLACVLMFGCWVGGLAFNPVQVQPDPELVRRVVPLALLAICLLNGLSSAGERAIAFSPAEVNLLFPGPFSRRHLLVYKILNGYLITLVTALFMALFLRVYSRWYFAAFLGTTLGLLFVQLFTIALALAASAVGERLAGRGRVAAVLTLVVAVAVTSGLRSPQLWSELTPSAGLDRLLESPVLRAVLTPLGWLADVFVAGDLGELFRALPGALSLCAALLVLVLLLDAHYLESAASASERLYARVERVRSSGALSALAEGGKARFTLPNPPWWGGIGPVAWRQALTLLRSLKGLVAMLAMVLVGTGLPTAFAIREGSAGPEFARSMLGMVFGMTLFLVSMVQFDFRADFDRIDVLKTLPVRPWALAVGQVLVPALAACSFQMLCVTALQVATGGLGFLLLTAFVFAPVFDFLLFGVLNLWFLWFPTRPGQHTVGDVGLVGRQALLMLGAYVTMLVLVGIPALTGVLVYYLAGERLAPALVLVWLVLAAECLGVVPLLAHAFGRFDVTRDTPP